MQVQPPNCVPCVQGLYPILPHGDGAGGVLEKVQPPPQNSAWRQEGAVPGHLWPDPGRGEGGWQGGLSLGGGEGAWQSCTGCSGKSS